MNKVILISALAYVTLGLGLTSRMGKQKLISDAQLSQSSGHRNNATHQDAINLIKNRTNLWTPFEADKHPFANKTDDELRGMAGTSYAGTSLQDLLNQA
jgi:hypothetical protein